MSENGRSPGRVWNHSERLRTFLVCTLVLAAAFSCFPPPARGSGPCEPERYVVAIDVGHSRHKPGAISSRGIGEFYFNQNIARQLRQQLHERGFVQAFLINEEGAPMALSRRTATAHHRGAHLFISIHHDSAQPHYLSQWEYNGKQLRYCDMFRGYSLFVSAKNRYPERSMAFAQLLGTELLARGFTPTLHHAERIPGEGRDLVDRERGIYRFSNLGVLRTAKMPAVLMECGVILNRDEEVLLQDPIYQQRLVTAIRVGIEKMCEEDKGPR